MTENIHKLLLEQSTGRGGLYPRSKISTTLRKQGYNDGCTAFLKDYWDKCLLACLLAPVYGHVQRELAYAQWDTVAAMPRSLLKILDELNPRRAEQIKEIFSLRTIKNLTKKHKGKLFLAAVLAVVGGVWTNSMYKDLTTQTDRDSVLDTIGDIFSLAIDIPFAYLFALHRSVKNMEKDPMGLNRNCAVPVYCLIGAAGIICAVALRKKTSIRPVKRIVDLLLEGFSKGLEKYRRGVDNLMLEAIQKILARRNVTLPPALEEFFANLPSNTSVYDDAAKQQAKDRLRQLDPDGEFIEEGEEIIELIFKDGTWQQRAAGDLAEETSQTARRSDDLFRQGAKKIEQMGFDLGDTPLRLPTPDVDDVPSLLLRADEAFNVGNVRKGLDHLEEFVQFYRQQKLFNDTNALKMTEQLITEIRMQFPEASDFEVMRMLISRSDEILSSIGSPATAKGIVAKIGQGQLELSDEAVESLLRKQIDDLLFYSTGNLPGVNPKQIPDMREEAVDSAMGFWQTLKGKVSGKVAFNMALFAIGSVITADMLFKMKKDKPTGSPYYFEDDSIYSILNGITGRTKWVEIQQNLLNDKQRMSELFDLFWDYQDDDSKSFDPAKEDFIIELSKEDAPEESEVDDKVDLVLKEYADLMNATLQAKDIGVLDNIGIKQSFGNFGNNEVDQNRQIEELQIIFEIFIFTDSIANDLKKFYLNKQLQGATEKEKLIQLRKIFGPSRRKRRASLQKMSDLHRYYANDNRMKSRNDRAINEVKQMSKKDLRKLVQEVLNENSGQGYGQYPYNSNEYTQEEPDQDYNVEWKSFVDEVCGSKRKNVDGNPKTVEDMAVEVAKVLVKDSDLFRDVLETAGMNKSIGVEIMSQIKATKEKNNLDKEMNV